MTRGTHSKAVTSGEEDEDTKAELRGVKLFIKRGKKEFSTGMLGHIKHLCDMNTGEERLGEYATPGSRVLYILKKVVPATMALVFRREPVWKVSMSVRLRPSIRCSFDKEQGVLRMALMELDEDSGEQHLVIYALKASHQRTYSFELFSLISWHLAARQVTQTGLC